LSGMPSGKSTSILTWSPTKRPPSGCRRTSYPWGAISDPEGVSVTSGVGVGDGVGGGDGEGAGDGVAVTVMTGVTVGWAASGAINARDLQEIRNIVKTTSTRRIV